MGSDSVKTGVYIPCNNKLQLVQNWMRKELKKFCEYNYQPTYIPSHAGKGKEGSFLTEEWDCYIPTSFFEYFPKSQHVTYIGNGGSCVSKKSKALQGLRITCQLGQWSQVKISFNPMVHGESGWVLYYSNYLLESTVNPYPLQNWSWKWINLILEQSTYFWCL